METAWPEVKLRGWSCRSRAGKKRSSQLEKEVATLSEKIHHLDDMLKSQQRKVRHMIEQLQNSKSVIQKKQAELQELQELVSYLEDEISPIPVSFPEPGDARSHRAPDRGPGEPRGRGQGQVQSDTGASCGKLPVLMLIVAVVLV
ncbi:uncharacterized protein M8220_007449 isoform 4-T4 [Acridotheres tristis]